MSPLFLLIPIGSKAESTYAEGRRKEKVIMAAIFFDKWLSEDDIVWKNNESAISINTHRK